MDYWSQLDETIINCRKCPRLVAWREQVAVTRRRAYRDQEYWGRPITGFGDRQGRLLVVGLAPGAHGANRTGRVFTGDSSGKFLFRALHAQGFANQAESLSREDALQLSDVYITAVCRCAPPDNKPTREEIDACLPYLGEELDLLPDIEGIVALGKIGFDNVLKAYRNRGVVIPRLEFGHGKSYSLGDGQPWLIASYHPSQQNTQTGRLTEAMFDEIWREARRRLNGLTG